MNQIYYYTLQEHLLAVILVSVWLIILWKQLRQRKIKIHITTEQELKEYKKLKRAGFWYTLLYLCFGIMALIYSIFPRFSYIFIPIAQLDKPFVNIMGLLVIGMALVWIIIAQLDIDKEIFKYSIGLHSRSPVKLLYYFERTLIFGMVLLFAGLFTTISNFAGLGLVIISIIIYLNLFTVPKGPKRIDKLWVER